MTTKTFVCDIEGPCTEGHSESLTVHRITIRAPEATAEQEAKAAARDYFAKNLGRTEVEVIVTIDG